MTPEQALQLLANYTAQMQLTRVQHEQLAQALMVLKTIAVPSQAASN